LFFALPVEDKTNQNSQKKIFSPKTRKLSTPMGLKLLLEISYKIERATFGLRHLMVFFGTMESILPILQVK
jgi:hypothetical protein